MKWWTRLIEQGVSRPSWRKEGRRTRPELWLAALVLVGMSLVEVWQSSAMARLCLDLEQNRTALERAHARSEFARAGLERRTTRGELAPLALELGLAPAEAQRVVTLPSAYLADAGPDGKDAATSQPALALAERVSRAIVPDARARSRNEN